MPTVTEISAQSASARQRGPAGQAPLTASRAATAPAVSRAAGKTVAICDTQPVTAEGIRNLLSGAGDLHFLLAAPSLSQVLDAARLHRTSVLMIDKRFGIQTIMESLGEAFPALAANRHRHLGRSNHRGRGAMRFLQCGARGILRKTVAVPVVLACLRNVAEGRTWMEDSVFRDNLHSERDPRAAGAGVGRTGPVEQGDRQRIRNPPGNGQDSQETHLRENRNPRPLWVGFDRTERPGIGIGSGLGAGGPTAAGAQRLVKWSFGRQNHLHMGPVSFGCADCVRRGQPFRHD